MVNVLLFGAGSVGGVYIYTLQQAGAKVTAVCRANYEAVKSAGFMMYSKRFGNVNFKPDNVVRSPEEAASETELWDFLVVCTKSFPGTIPSTADRIKPAVGASTVIVLIQNGIGIEEEIAVSFPANPLLSCVAYIPVAQTGPGIIHHMETLDLLEIGTYPASASQSHKRMAQQFAALVNEGGGDAQIYDDVQPCRWSKLIVNASWNPIGALSMCSDVDFLCSSPGAIELVRGVMLEIVALAQALKIQGIDESLAEWHLERVRKRVEKGGGVETSMLADVRNGRPFELEAILGNPVRIARHQGIKVPLLDTLYALAKARYDAIIRSN